jgi:phosphoserine phosphatase RsbU/P
MLASIALWLANWMLSNGTTILGSAGLKFVFDVLSVIALLPFVYWVFRATAYFVDKLLWRLRRRLIVTYLLIGLLPLTLLLALTGLIGYLVILESNARLVQKQLANRLSEAQVITRSLAEELSRAEPATLNARLNDLTRTWQPIFPDVRLRIVREKEGLPAWTMAQAESHGWIMHASNADEAREVYGFHSVRLRQGDPAWLQVRYGVAGLSEQLSRATGLQVNTGHASLELLRTVNGETQLEVKASSQTVAGLPIFVPMREWDSGREVEAEALHLDPGFLLPANLWQGFMRFRQESAMGYVLFWTIGGISVIFALIAAFAVTAAMVMTRSVTNAVYYLYEGTQRVEAGDLENEIRVIGHDQLGELGHSFNRMIRSLRELLRVSVEKQRLDQEMKIAAQVQARLFPRTLPKLASLDLAEGVCQPARTVSGDYFDYFEITPGLLGLVVADVCGKGVSAALLMANLQAHLRSQALTVSTQPRDLCAIIKYVNQRIVEASPDSSYVTLFYAEYDEAASTLCYVNAGHNPPMILRGDDALHLTEGGTVVGLFKDSEYVATSVPLVSGDLFVAFTDGLLEARNPQDEELGEERLLLWLQAQSTASAEAIKQDILQRVATWAGHAEQEDDLTLLVWRKL